MAAGTRRTAGTAPVVLLLLAVGLAGCLGAPPDDGGAGAATVPSDEGPHFGLASDLFPERPPGYAPTLDAPPEYAVGEWWTYEMTFPTYDRTAEITRVVAGAEGGPQGNYLIGWDVETFDHAVMVLHFPGFGQVNRTTLGFEAHDLMIELVNFPLTDGASWTTQWYSGTPLPAEVTSVDADAGTARVHLENEQRTIDLTYDADLGVISEMTISDYLTLEVVDHGFGFDGIARVPYGHDLLFCHGRVVGVVAIEPCALDLMDPSVGGPDIEVDVPDGYTGASFGLLMQDLDATAPVGLGVHTVEVTDPDGTTYAAEKLPTDGSTKLVPHGAEVGTGTWQVRAVAGGAGLSLFEGVAYTIYDVEEPATAVGPMAE